METAANTNSNLNGSNDDKVHGRSGRVLGGIVLLLIGSSIMMHQLGVLLPEWFHSFWMIPIAVGIFLGARRSFRPGGWMIPIVIGCAFLAEEFIPGVEVHHFIGPVIIIGVGLVMIFRPRRNKC